MKWMMLYCYAIHNGIITEWNDDWTDLSEWSRSKQTTVCLSCEPTWQTVQHGRSNVKGRLLRLNSGCVFFFFFQNNMFYKYSKGFKIPAQLMTCFSPLSKPPCLWKCKSGKLKKLFSAWALQWSHPLRLCLERSRATAHIFHQGVLKRKSYLSWELRWRIQQMKNQ